MESYGWRQTINGFIKYPYTLGVWHDVIKAFPAIKRLVWRNEEELVLTSYDRSASVYTGQAYPRSNQDHNIIVSIATTHVFVSQN